MRSSRLNQPQFIGEELGMFGILGLIGLYGMIGYAGLRVAKLAADRYSKLLAAGLTSLILCQATLNFFAVRSPAYPIMP